MWKAGDSVLAYDRIGTGKSDKPDAYSIIQAPAQVEILKGLTVLARNGGLAKSAPNNTSISIPKIEKVILVGHSIGSAFTLASLSLYGATVDAVVATGFIFSTHPLANAVATMGVEFAPENDPRKFGNRPSGYLVQGTKYNGEQFFLKKGNYEAGVLDYAASIKETFTLGETAAIGAVTAAPAFKGPLLVSRALQRIGTRGAKLTDAPPSLCLGRTISQSAPATVRGHTTSRISSQRFTPRRPPWTSILSPQVAMG